MGKAIPGTGPNMISFAGRPAFDVERLQGEALKVYLEHKLRELDQQISTFSASGDQRPRTEPSTARQPLSSQEDEWGLIMDLGYLRASRDAIISALSIL